MVLRFFQSNRFCKCITDPQKRTVSTYEKKRAAYKEKTALLTKEKSARRESNPRPSPWQGDVVPLYYSRTALVLYTSYIRMSSINFIPDNAQGRNRTNDIRIFSPPLYQLSYRGISPDFRLNCRRPGSNRYEYHYSRDFKSRASASSATPAQMPSGENGRRWIRTTEAICSRFTVCPLWPLGNSPKMS